MSQETETQSFSVAQVLEMGYKALEIQHRILVGINKANPDFGELKVSENTVSINEFLEEVPKVALIMIEMEKVIKDIQAKQVTQ